MQVPPPDNMIYVRFAGKNPKKTRWVFHGMFENPKCNNRGWAMLRIPKRLVMILEWKDCVFVVVVVIVVGYLF